MTIIWYLGPSSRTRRPLKIRALYPYAMKLYMVHEPSALSAFISSLRLGERSRRTGVLGWRMVFPCFCDVSVCGRAFCPRDKVEMLRRVLNPTSTPKPESLISSLPSWFEKDFTAPPTPDNLGECMCFRVESLGRKML